jgi:carbonic anhydrase
VQKLVQGIHKFQDAIFTSQSELFARLSHGQTPDALFITCSDSRIVPNLITQTEAGDLFLLRNAGNIVPAFGGAVTGEEATIEFAVVALGIKDIIICGHSLCGAMRGLAFPDTLKELPSMSSWLSHADATRRILRESYSHLSGDELHTAAVEENVLVQLENLRTHPSVAARLAKNELNLHGWVYKLETGRVFGYDPREGQFSPLAVETPATKRGGVTI